MARPLLVSVHGFGTQAGMAGVSLVLCAVALLMCASRSRSRVWRHWRACYEPDTDYSTHRHVIHHVGTGPENTDVDEEEEAVWRRNILMGGKCELPDFSGVIIYDSNGSVVAPSKTPRLMLPWK